MKLSRFPFYRQMDQMDCGPTCLRMVAKFYGRSISLEKLRNMSNITREGITMAGIIEAAEAVGFRTLPVRVNFDTLHKEVPGPCIAHWKEKHFIVVYDTNQKEVKIADPARGKIRMKKEEFIKGWSANRNANENAEGFLLLLEPTNRYYEQEDEHEKEHTFAFLATYLKPYKKFIYQLIIGLLIGSLLQLIFPFLTQSLVDYGINYQNLNFVYLILFAQVTLFISQSSVEIIRGWLLLHITNRINLNLISDFLMKLMQLPIAYFDSKNTGDIMQRIQDNHRVQNFLSSATLNTLFSFVNLVVFGIVLGLYHINILMIFLVGSSLYLVWTLIFLKKRKRIDQKRFEHLSENQGNLMQLIQGMQEIKLNGSERRRRWEWEEIQVQLFKTFMRSLELSQKQNNGGRILNELKNILITFVAAKAVIDGQLTLGMMLSVQYIIGQLNLPLNNFVTFIQTGQDAQMSLERMAEIHKRKNEDTDDNHGILTLPSKHDIQIQNLSFRYGGHFSPFVLKDIDLEIPVGKVTAIVGPSGSGKTTLLKLLLKFYPITKGKITIGGSNLGDFHTRAWRRLCGTVMQEGYLFDDSILRNITESDSERSIDRDRLHQAIKVANLTDFIEALPRGIHTKVGLSGINISGGQKQRIFIARAIYKEPEFLFLDEATSALDANNESSIMRQLVDFYNGKTVVIVAHRLSTVKNADQIIVLEDGQIIERGTHEDLTYARGSYYTLVKNQLELGNS